jgi:hypothetical protein
MRRLLHALAATLAVSAFAAGCRPGVGSRCEKGEARCVDQKRGLSCEGGQFIEVPCSGARGCSTSEAGVACDVSGNRQGDRCSRDEEGAAVCQGPNAIIACHGGRFDVSPCRGAHGCVVEGGRAVCDTSIGIAGEACREDGKKACATDGSVVLSCSSGALAPLYLCRGPKKCASASGKLECDMSVAAAGDACDPRMEGHFACDAGLSALLVCKAGRFVSDENCKLGTKCVAEGNQTHCVKG